MRMQKFCLMMLRRESGVEKKYGVLARNALGKQQKQRESSLHGADSGHYAASGDIYVKKRLEKIGGTVLERLDAGYVGILVG